MTHTEEQILKLVSTLEYFKGYSSEQLKKNVDWLKNMSIDGIEFYLIQGVRKGYISERTKGDDIVYYAKQKGINMTIKMFA